MLLWLFNLVKIQYFSWSHPSCCIPSSCIRMNIMINKSFLKIVSSIPPILLQIKTKVTGCHLSCSVRNKACCFQISHYCIYDWHSCFSIFPSLYYFLVCFPFFSLRSISITIFKKYFILVFVSPIMPEITPE